MLTKSYNQTKKEVLDIYANYESLLEKNNIAVPENIQREADKIAKDIFRLVVLGEAKSGKSTFINAYLGQEILPMDVLQCTSAIIKIHKGSVAKLKAITADDSSKTIKGAEKIKNFLKQNAAIADEYRCIPVTTINQEILIKKKGKIPSKIFIKEFCENFKDENITNMDFEKYVQKVYEYVQKNSKNWKKLIKEIDIEFPLPEEFRGVTIVDTPGVGAAGNVGVITEEYMDKAEAIIFVKFATGQALESLSFKNFLAKTCKEKNKDRLFLLLTGISLLEKTDLNNLKNQANELYERYIPKERIVFVDSKLELILKNCLSRKDNDEIDNYLEHEADTKGGIYDTVERKWLKARGNIDKFSESINEQSNYPMARQVVDKFARIANYLALNAFLENLNIQLNMHIAIQKENIKILIENGNDLEALKKEIDKVTKKLQKQKIDFFDSFREKSRGYVCSDGIITRSTQKLKDDVTQGLEKFLLLKESSITNDTFLELRKFCFDKIAEAQELKQKLGEEAVKDCESLIDSDFIYIPNEIFKPNFTTTDYDSLDAEAEKKSSGTEYKKIKDGITFDDYKYVSYHHLSKHVRIIAESIKTRLNEEIIPKMESNVRDYVDTVFKQYKTQVENNLKFYESNLAQLQVKKSEAESNQLTIDEYKEKERTLNEFQKEVNYVKQEIQSYVKSTN